MFYDAEGRLWMIYGSYSGGIFVKEMDPDTGLPLEPGYGKKLLGGNHLRIEAPYILYNEETGYYYMFLSFGGLDSDGGYNIRVCRSETPDGPYYDSMGNDMIDCKGPANSTFSDVTAQQYGTKLMGGYKFLWQEGESGEDRKGYLSPGHNSCLYDEESGKYFIIYHTRFEKSGEEHQVRVHQMFFNADGWPVIAPYRYTGETIGAYDDSEVVGSYKWIDHGREITPEMQTSCNVELKKNGKITGDVTGTWSRSGDHDITLEVDGKTYSGVLLRQWDEDGQKDVMTFTAVCAETGTCHLGQRFGGAGQQRSRITMAKLNIYADRPLSTIAPEIYGHFSEHLGRCIYEGIYVGEDSDIPNVNGMRCDVVEALKQIRIPVLRWPRRLLCRRVPLERRHRPPRSSGKR